VDPALHTTAFPGADFGQYLVAILSYITTYQDPHLPSRKFVVVIILDGLLIAVQLLLDLELEFLAACYEAMP
jgi:hypothetical protein